MTNQLIIAGIKAILRAAQAGADLYAEHSRDRVIFLPDIQLPGKTRNTRLRQFLEKNPQLITEGSVFAQVWDAENKVLIFASPDIMDNAVALMLRHEARKSLDEDGLDEQEAKETADLLEGGRMVEQWRIDRKPPSPYIRMVLTITDIGLEFVASDPSILGLGSRGEKLIGSLAAHMSELIPDTVRNFGPKENFADRIVGMVLRSGLATLADNADLVISDKNVAKLVTEFSKPVVEAFPSTAAEQISYQKIVDAIMGPAASAAFKLLAEDTENYLGSDFANDAALGALTTAVFKSIQATTANGTIVDVFTEEGLIEIYRSGLLVAKNRPQLFIKDDGEPKTEAFQELLSGTAAVLSKNPKLKGRAGAELAAMAIGVVGNNAATLLRLDEHKPWENLAADLITQVTGSLETALNNPTGAMKLFGEEHIVELGRIVLLQVAATPGMVGVDRTEVASIIIAMTTTMAADDKLLLSENEWLSILAVAAKTAAANPGRLFKIEADDAASSLALLVITNILKTASVEWQAKGRSEGNVLFGETLREIIEITLEGLAGNIQGVVSSEALVSRLIEQIMAKAAADPQRIGSETLRKLFAHLLVQVLATGQLPSDTDIDNLLKGVSP